MSKIIDLRSDTVTKPTPAMLQAMMNATVGDDVFGEDPTVNELEAYAADLFGMEAAIYCPSGTMTNQIAVKAHTRPLDEIICHASCHIYNYEVAGYASNSGVGVKLVHSDNGIMTPEATEACINADYDWLPVSSLVAIENTCNKVGGSYYTYKQMAALAAVAQKHQLKYHLDGARLFNALVEINSTPKEVGQLFDSISLCLSKGLGAPVGSVLLGSKPYIRRARRIRKSMGGGMRQAGFLAAACLYALKNNITRLKDDHIRAKNLSEYLAQHPLVDKVHPVYTNIIKFDVVKEITVPNFLLQLEKHNIKAIQFGPKSIRMTTHMQINDKDIAMCKSVMDQFSLSLT